MSGEVDQAAERLHALALLVRQADGGEVLDLFEKDQAISVSPDVGPSGSLIDSAIAAVADERPGSGEKLLAVALSVKLTLALGSREAGDFLIHMGVRAKQSGEGGAA